MSLTAAEIVDTRRYCGYPVSAAVATYPDEAVRNNSAVLDIVLASLSVEQETILRTAYLTTLRTLEAAIPAAGANLDTSKAAVWTHNPTEVPERQGLYYGWRIQLCMFLGVPAGPGVTAPVTNMPVVDGNGNPISGTGNLCCGGTLVPAAFAL